MVSELTRREVMRLTGDGERSRANGNIAVAIDYYARACALVRQVVQAGRGDRESLQQLGAMLYTLGEWRMAAEDFQVAIDELSEAEAAYEALGAERAPLVTDVVIRLARVHAAARHPLSAIVDVQRAVLAC